MDFLRKCPEITFVKEYCDDGYTGANFDRPDFQKMMEAVKQGEIDCVIVKDDYVIIGDKSESLKNTGVSLILSNFCAPDNRRHEGLRELWPYGKEEDSNSSKGSSAPANGVSLIRTDLTVPTEVS